MNQPKKQKTWIKFRHKIVTEILRYTIGLYSRLRYHAKVERFEKQGNRPYLILLNHQTPFDQFLLGTAFRGPIYYMATEDIFSMGFVSSLIRFLIAPIPIKKQATDLHAVKNCIRIAKEGGTICIAPEGNRTYSGRTVYINPAIAPLIKKLKLPVLLFRIENGYGVEPRWSTVVRKGKMRAYVSEVIEPEEFENLTNEEIFKRVKDGLFVDEACVSGTFYHKKCAEFLERAIYVCPYCGLSEFHSSGDIVTCKKCGKQVRYLPTKELEGVGFDFPFRFVANWYDYQNEFVNKLDVFEYIDKPLYRDTARLSEVILYKHKETLRKDASFALYGDRVVVDEGTDQELVFPFDQVSVMTVLDRNKLNIYHDKKVYQIKGGSRFNALKYMNIFHRHKNIVKGDENDKFLGL